MTRRRFTAAEKAEVLDRQNGLCDCGCGRSILDAVEFDHTIAIALGGQDALHNINARLPECHLRKTKIDVKMIAKAKRRKRKHGLDDDARAERERRAAKKPKIAQRKSTGGLVRKLDGAVVRRDGPAKMS
jgi:5-methylcytosine-specific restriction endonuclease McrA